MEKTSEQKAYDYALFLLGIKLRTEGELREKLRSKNYELGITNEVISKLKEARYVNDQNYAEVYLENLKKYKTFGFYGIKKKLMEKRLPSNIIESVLSEGLSEEEEIKIAKKFLRKQQFPIVILRPSDSEGEESQNKRSFAEAQDDRGKSMRLAQKLKSRGFRGSVVARMLF